MLLIYITGIATAHTGGFRYTSDSLFLVAEVFIALDDNVLLLNSNYFMNY